MDLAAELGLNADESVAREAAVNALRFMNQHTLIRSAEEEERMYLRYYKLILEGLGLREGVPERAAELNRRFRIEQCWLAPFEETVPVLEALRAAGFRLAVVSDGFPSLRSDYRRLGLDGYFEAIVVASEHGAWKPDRRVYEAALKQLEASPTDCWYLDDTPEDAGGAAALGMRSYLLDRLGQHDASPLPRVQTLTEFAAVMGIVIT